MSVLASSSWIPGEEPFDTPPVGELFNFPPLVELAGGLLDINRVVLIIWTATLAVMLLFWLAFGNARIVPNRLQAGAEAIVSFVRDSVAIDIMGPEGRRYVPLLTTFFMFIWFNNLFGVIPFVNFPSTSRIAIPLFMAIITWITFLVIGIVRQGPIGYFKDVLFPPGVPLAMKPLIALIEFVSNILVRPVTLTVRLFANMVAGHILLTIVFLAIHAFLYFGRGLPIGLLVLAVSPLAVAFELFIEFLQAYIFIILTSVYISGALHPAH
jgi:F-type H+-transporting ATPase subunit a